MSQIGPKVTIVASCFGCVHERSKKYQIQGDSGIDVYCDNPDSIRNDVGDTSWVTPSWCPLLESAIAKVKAGDQ